MNLFSRRGVLFLTIRSHFACGAILIIAFENIYVLLHLHYSPAFSKKRNQRRFCLLHGFQFIFLWHFNDYPLHIFYAHRHRHRHTRTHTHTHTYIYVYIYYIYIVYIYIYYVYLYVCVKYMYIWIKMKDVYVCLSVCPAISVISWLDFKRVISIPD